MYGARGGAVGWGTALQFGRSRVRFPMVWLEFFTDIILPVTLWPWGDSAFNRNEYQEYFLRGKGGCCLRLTTLPSSCAECLEIWEPQTPKLCRPVQACNGIGLLYLFYYIVLYVSDCNFARADNCSPPYAKAWLGFDSRPVCVIFVEDSSTGTSPSPVCTMPPHQPAHFSSPSLDALFS